MPNQFTPGPWGFEIHKFFPSGVITGGRNGEEAIAEILPIERGSTETEANARLIRNAPELFAALEVLLDTSPLPDNGNQAEIHMRAMDAIAKVKGESR